MTLSYPDITGRRRTTDPRLTREQVAAMFAELTAQRMRGFADTSLDEPVGPVTFEEAEALGAEQVFFIGALAGG